MVYSTNRDMKYLSCFDNNKTVTVEFFVPLRCNDKMFEFRILKPPIDVIENNFEIQTFYMLDFLFLVILTTASILFVQEFHIYYLVAIPFRCL